MDKEQIKRELKTLLKQLEDEKAKPNKDLNKIAQYQYNIACKYDELQNFETAIIQLRDSAQNFQKVYPSNNHIDLATTFYMTALVFNKQNNLEKSQKYFNNALIVYKKCLPPNHQNIATALINIAWILDKQGKYTEAIDYYKESIKIDEKRVPVDDIEIALTFYSIGLAYEKLERFEKAEGYYRIAFEKYVKKLPPNHLDLAKVLDRLGKTYLAMGKLDDAWPKINDAYMIRKTQLDADNPTLAYSLTTYGDYLRVTGRFKEAKEKYYEAMAACKNLALVNLDRADIWHSMGLLFCDTKEYDNSLKYLSRSLDVRKTLLPSGHFDIQKARNYLGLAYKMKGDYEKALEYIKDEKMRNEIKELNEKKKTCRFSDQNIVVELPKNHKNPPRVSEPFFKIPNDCKHSPRDNKPKLEKFDLTCKLVKPRPKSVPLKDLNNLKIREDKAKAVEPSSSGSDTILPVSRKPSRKSSPLLYLNKVKSPEPKKKDIKADEPNGSDVTILPRPLSRKDDPLIGETFNNRYQAMKKLGKGTFGRVFLVYDNIDKTEKAMKMMEKYKYDNNELRGKQLPPELSKTALNELLMMKKLFHENIIRYFDHFDEQCFGVDYLCIICEYCKNLDLKVKINEAREKNRSFSNYVILDWTMQAMNGLDYLHSHNIIHRDIKPANIFLDKDKKIKLGDLGLAKLMEDTKASTFTGSPAYMSPEQFRCYSEHGSYSTPSDIWSLGCVFFELVFLEIAFPGGQKANPPVPNLGLGVFSPILKKMLDKDPNKRASTKQLIADLLKIKKLIS